MAAKAGPAVTSGAVFSIDAANKKSTLRSTQQNNLLVDAHTWSVGIDSSSGYGRNGDATEQSRVDITDDPWGGNSVVWATTPDAVSGADGGWNTSYYPIDQNKRYRYSVWARRHTAGTGGTFYFGMNPAPIRNDNGLVQGNPYFCHPGQSSMSLNQWYLIVSNCFPQSYRGGRHTDSGWYTNGNKISDLSYGNVGSQDVRWNPGTTTAMHRAYHYYTTNTASGLQFAYPRIDLCDGNEPSIYDLLGTGESSSKNLTNANTFAKKVNLKTFNTNNGGSYTFNGTNDTMSLSPAAIPAASSFTFSLWANISAVQAASIIEAKNSVGGRTINVHLPWSDNNVYFDSGAPNGSAAYSRLIYATTLADRTGWHYWTFIKNLSNSTISILIDGKQVATGPSSLVTGTTTIANIGSYAGGTSNFFKGEVSNIKIYNRALSTNQVKRNFNALRGRYDI